MAFPGGFDLEELTRPYSDRKVASALFLIFLAAYCSLVVLRDMPLGGDEGWLSLSIIEFSHDPSIIMPTLVGEHLELKPPLFIWVFSFFHLILRSLPLQIEAVMRLPSALFAALNVSLVFLIAGRFYSRKTALAGALLFALMPLAAFSATRAVMESFSLFLSLVSIYFYIRGRFAPASLSLGLLTLTKWMYAAAPVIFVALYFLGDKKLRQVLLSFLVIPVALGAYVLLAAGFGSLDNALANLTLDLSRPVPTIDPLLIAYNFVYMIMNTFPVSPIFLFLLLSRGYDAWNERCFVAFGVLAFVLPFSSYFLFWYVITLAPALAIFLARRMEDIGSAQLYSVMLAGLLIISIVVSAGVPGPTGSEVKEIAGLMKGRNVTFLEFSEPGTGWKPVADAFRGSGKQFILLEQFNAGLLFYRFYDSDDYGNLHGLFASYNETPSCGGYLVVHTMERESYGYSPPSCFVLLNKSEFYSLYAPLNRSAAD